jgi:hypothetical protein
LPSCLLPVSEWSQLSLSLLTYSIQKIWWSELNSHCGSLHVLQSETPCALAAAALLFFLSYSLKS